MRNLGLPQDLKTISTLMGTLQKVAPLAHLSEAQLRKMLYFIRFSEYDADEVVFRKGDAGDSFYVIHSGEVEAFLPGIIGKQVLRTMRTGDFFGELALMLGQPRSASVSCRRLTQCFVLDKGEFDVFMERNPDVRGVIKDAARERYENAGVPSPPDDLMPVGIPESPAPAAVFKTVLGFIVFSALAVGLFITLRMILGSGAR